MKKVIVFICFLAGAICFISAGLYINKQNAGIEYVEEPVTKVKSPELLSEINMTQYVSLPASFSDIDIVEDLDNIEVTEDNVDDVMYEQLDKTASHLATIESDNNITILMDYTVTQDNQVKDVKNEFKTAYTSKSKVYDDTVYEALKNAAIGASVHVENASFNGFDNAIVDITITDIIDMPYPVTDEYISKNTEYNSVYNMRTALINDSSGKAKEIAREHTINTLIDTMMDQTTFIKLPDSLVMKELEVLQKDNPNATYDEAKHSLYKIFFIAAVIKDYDVATKSDMEKRYAKLDDSEKNGLSEYEIERKKYLLFEEDVVTCIYKKVQINNTENAEGSNVIVESNAETEQMQEQQPVDVSTESDGTSIDISAESDNTSIPEPTDDSSENIEEDTEIAIPEG